MSDISWFKAASARAQLRRVLVDLNRVQARLTVGSHQVRECVDTVQRLIVDLDVEAPMIVHAIIFSNYFPEEVDSLWIDAVEAQKRCDELNDRHDAPVWAVVPMSLKSEWKPGD